MRLDQRGERSKSSQRGTLISERRDIFRTLEDDPLRYALHACFLMCDFAALDRIADAAHVLTLAIECLNRRAQLRELVQPLARSRFTERHDIREQRFRARKQRDHRSAGPPQLARTLANVLRRYHALALTE